LSKAKSARFSTQKNPAVAGAAIAAAGLGWTIFKGIWDNKGDIEWNLFRMDGAKHPFEQKAKYENIGVWKEQVIKVQSKSENYISDEISATFNLRFKSNGHSVGYVDIDVIDTNDAVGWGLIVEAKIMADPNAYKINNVEPVAALDVTFNFRYTRSIGSDIIRVMRLKLYGNGEWKEIP
jgi:hypothetical protein